jgi:hypothetical protein
MEHHWDEAFGLLGVPIDFANDTQHLRYIGSFSNLVNQGQTFNTPLFTAFLMGRAAISHKDMGTRQTQVSAILAALEQVEAGVIIHEMNQVDQLGASNPASFAAVSTALGVIRGFAYDTDASRTITNTQIAELETKVGYNVYNFLGDASLTSQVRSLLGDVYGFTTEEMAAF